MTFSRVRRLALGASLFLSTFLAAAPTFAQTIVNGWSQFTPSPDTRIVYVSSSSGNDGNNGLSQGAPKRTLAAGYAMMREGYPDWLLLKCGDTWHENFVAWDRSGRSTAEMMRLGSYGSGERPRLLTGTSSGLWAGSWGPTRGHLAITGIAFVCDGYNGSNGLPRGVEVYGNFSDVLLEDCYFEKYFVNIMFEADPATQNLSNIRLRRCVVVDAFRVGAEHAEGSYFAGVNGLLVEDCFFDHNGWNENVSGAVTNIFRHNIYIQTNCSNVTTRGIISARAAATGMQQRSGGMCENHVFLQNPLGIVFGTGGTVRNNCVMDSRDIDWSLPRGIGIELSGGSNHEVYGNVCAWRTQPGTWNIVALSLDNEVRGANVHDNIVWKWWVPGCNASTGMEVGGSPAPPLYFRNNIIQMPTGGDAFSNLPSVALTLSSNRYYAQGNYPFRLGPTPMSYSQWTGSVYDPGSTFGQVSFPDPDRTISSYMSWLGRPASLPAFLAEARQQSKSYWRPEFTAQGVNNYIRGGFGLNLIGNGGGCPADINADGVLNMNDMVAFQKWYFRGDMRADVNHDGTLTIQDLTQYQATFNSGCP